TQQQRQLAEELSRAEAIDEPPRSACPDLELSAETHEEGVAVLALGADGVATMVRHLDEPLGDRLQLLAVEAAEQWNPGENLETAGDRCNTHISIACGYDWGTACVKRARPAAGRAMGNGVRPSHP